LYVLYDAGLFACYDAATGKEIYTRQRIPNGRAFTSSPWAYGDKIFCLNEEGKTFVIQAGDEFKVLGTNEFEEDDMGMASPAILGDRVLVRTAARIYCIAKNP
jgi:outer membrane protein assembly factor BamB